MGFGFCIGLVGGINKFSGLINGEAVCGKGRGGEREGDETVLLGTWVLELVWELDKTIWVEGGSGKSEVIWKEQQKKNNTATEN